VPEEQLNKFNWMTNDESMCSAQTPYIYPGFNGTYQCRQTYLSMVNMLDQFIGNVTQQLKDGGFWNNTLVVFSADSLFFGSIGSVDSWVVDGGCIYLPESGGNNYPLRGGKYSQFEGGIRSTAFVSGGYLPEAVRGTQQSGLISIADWYATFTSMVGVDPFDEWAAESGLPPVDGLARVIGRSCIM
jgi:arylsulfatase A-like enzyme